MEREEANQQALPIFRVQPIRYLVCRRFLHATDPYRQLADSPSRSLRFSRLPTPSQPPLPSFSSRHPLARSQLDYRAAAEHQREHKVRLYPLHPSQYPIDIGECFKTRVLLADNEQQSLTSRLRSLFLCSQTRLTAQTPIYDQS